MSRMVVALEKREVVWNDGILSGDEELIRLIEERVQSIHFVLSPATDEPVKTVIDDPTNRVGALAALICLHPGITQILEIDADTFEQFYGKRETIERIEQTRGGVYFSLKQLVSFIRRNG